MCNSKLKEQKEHSSILLPYSYYSGEIPTHYSRVSIHWHTEFEIIKIMFGECEIMYGSETFTAREGDILIIPPNTLHGIFPYNNFKMQFSSIVFNSSIFGNTLSERSYMHYIQPLISGTLMLPIIISKGSSVYQKLSKTILLVFSHAKKHDELDDLFIKSYLLLFFGTFFKGQAEYPRKTITDKFIVSTVDYISNNYKYDIKIQHLANNVKFSPSYFMKLFKEYTGLTVIEYINRFRIEKACALLLSTNLSISTIAFEVGFKNISNFNRFFKKITHFTPVKYKRQMKTTEN